MLTGEDRITQDLFKFLCEHSISGTEEEIFQNWVHQLPEVPPPDSLPICFQMIRNMQKTAIPKEQLQKYGKMFY